VLRDSGSFRRCVHFASTSQLHLIIFRFLFSAAAIIRGRFATVFRRLPLEAQYSTSLIRGRLQVAGNTATMMIFRTSSIAMGYIVRLPFYHATFPDFVNDNNNEEDEKKSSILSRVLYRFLGIRMPSVMALLRWRQPLAIRP
jgi:hypothetical protein